MLTNNQMGFVTKPNLTVVDGPLPRYMPGSKYEDGEGACYRYCQFDADMAVGKSIASELGDVIDLTSNVDVNSTDGASAGDSQFTLTHASALDNVTLNSLIGWTLWDQSSGYKYQIKSNTAMASDIVTIQLETPLGDALADDDLLWIIPPFWRNVVAADAAAEDRYIGQLMAGVDVTTAIPTKFAWVCTRGIATGIAGSDFNGLSAGSQVMVSATAGQVGPNTLTGNAATELPAVIGRLLINIANGNVLFEITGGLD